MSTAPHVPAPPPGPGVQPPFPAPPVEGRGRRIGLGVGVGIGVLVLVCGGGLAAAIGVGIFTQGAVQEQADVAVRDYLDALRSRNYDRAYELLCDSAKQEETATDFRERVSSERQITSYTIGDISIVDAVVPVDATYADGSVVALEAHLEQDRDTGGFEVCDLGE